MGLPLLSTTADPLLVVHTSLLLLAMAGTDIMAKVIATANVDVVFILKFLCDCLLTKLWGMVFDWFLFNAIIMNAYLIHVEYIMINNEKTLNYLLPLFQEHRARKIVVLLMAKKHRRNTSSAITSMPALKTASLKLNL
jgi:hypothetical protein